MDELLKLATSQGAIVTLLLIIIVTGMRGDWVFGWVFRQMLAGGDKDLADMRQDRDFWRASALRGLHTTETALNVVEKQTR